MQSYQNFLELPFIFEPKALQADLAAVRTDEWVAHPNKDAYVGEWLVSSLMSIDGSTRQINAIEHQNYLPTPLLKRMRTIPKILDSFHTTIEAVRFMKLGAGALIKRHCDKGSSFEEGLTRIHIPILTNEAVEFHLNETVHQMVEGKCYYINAHHPHSVRNQGKDARVHLLIDCHVNGWLEKIFEQQGFVVPASKYLQKGFTDENVDAVIASLRALKSDVALKMADALLKQKG